MHELSIYIYIYVCGLLAGNSFARYGTNSKRLALTCPINKFYRNKQDKNEVNIVGPVPFVGTSK